MSFTPEKKPNISNLINDPSMRRIDISPSYKKIVKTLEFPTTNQYYPQLRRCRPQHKLLNPNYHFWTECI